MTEAQDKPLKVLVLCTGNSCRSIMGEALFNALGEGRIEAVSAGSFPTGEVHPRALETLARHDIDAGEPHSKSWDDFIGTELDLVVTVCDQAAGESCPFFPGNPKKLHWSTPDPAHVEGTEDVINAAFDTAYNMLRERIESFLAAPDNLPGAEANTEKEAANDRRANPSGPGGI